MVGDSPTFTDILTVNFRGLEKYLPEQAPLLLPGSTSVAECLQSLALHHLRGCVITDAPHSKLDETNIKLLDMRDIVRCFLRDFKELGSDDATKMRNFATKTVGPMANISEHNNFRSLTCSATLSDIAKAFHCSPRVPIFEGGKLIRIFGIYDFICILAKSKCLETLNDTSRLHGMLTQEFTKYFGKELMERGVECIDETTSLFDTMKKIDSTGYSALPIVEEAKAVHKKCIGLISVRDLKLLFLTPVVMDGKYLRRPGIEYLTMVRAQTPKATFPFIHTSTTSSLLTIISKILGTSVHRILLLDEHQNLTGVVSVTDVAKILAHEAEVPGQ